MPEDLFRGGAFSCEIPDNTDLQEYNGMLFFMTAMSSKTKTGKADRHMDAPPNILRTRDLAILLDMSPDAVNDLARKGILKGYKSGNQWRFRRKDIERYLDREAKNLVPPG